MRQFSLQSANRPMGEGSEGRLVALLLEGIASGEAIDATAEFWCELRCDAVAILAGKSCCRSFGSLCCGTVYPTI